LAQASLVVQLLLQVQERAQPLGLAPALPPLVSVLVAQVLVLQRLSVVQPLAAPLWGPQPSADQPWRLARVRGLVPAETEARPGRRPLELAPALERASPLRALLLALQLASGFAGRRLRLALFFPVPQCEIALL
jgi:hypothetical protein